MELPFATPGTLTRLILSRRSIRSGFDGAPLSEESLEAIVRCGLAAPSSKNSMPWRLHVVTDRRALAYIAKAMRESPRVTTYVPHDPLTGLPRPEYRSTVIDSSNVLDDVPAAIVIEHVAPFTHSIDVLTTTDRRHLPSAIFGLALEMIGVGAALENMWLAALDQGYQACFLGDVAIAEGAIKELLGFEGDVLGALAIGRSDAAPVSPMDSPARPEAARVIRHS